MGTKDNKKKKTDLHSRLDWCQIANDLPDETIKDKNKTVNRGIKFENLIEKLLPAMFAGEESWQRTQETNDGKKDFIRYINADLNEAEWAECKNYESNLSINVLSPTMVMATLEGVNTIYFFSRSPLNDNAIESVIRYSKTTKKNVRIVDGQLLEAFIVKYWEKPEIRKFFNNQTDIFDPTLYLKKAPKLQIIKLIRDFQGNKLESGKIFAKGEKFRLCIILRNISTKEIDYSIKIKQSSNKVLFENIASEVGFLEPGSTKELSYPCDTLLSGKVEFKAQITSEQVLREINYKLEITEESYTLWTGPSAFSICNTCLEHLKSYNQKHLAICGADGTGKSTLLTILTQNEDICSKYRIIDVENNLTRNQIFQAILYKSIGTDNESVIPVEQLEEEVYLTDIMFNNYVQSDKQFAKAVMKIYRQDKPFLFTFDNANSISRNHRDIIRALVNESNSQNKKIYFIFTINDNNGDGLNNFLYNMGWENLSDNSDIIKVDLEKFKCNDIIDCLKLGYGLSNFEYAFEGFDKNVSPLDIRNFVDELKKQYVICRLKGNTYGITDKKKFKNLVQTSLYANSSFHAQCLNLNDTSKFVMKYLYVVEKMCPQVKSNYSAAVSELLKLGFIKYEQNNLILANEHFAKSIKHNFPFTADDYADIYDNDYADCGAKAICALNLISHRQKEKTEFLEYFFQVGNKDLRPSRRYESCSLIFDKFNYIEDLNLATSALNYVKINLPYFNKEQGHDSTYALYEKIANAAINCNIDGGYCVGAITELMKKVLDRALSTYHNDECYGFAMAFIDKIKVAQNINYKDKNFWLSHFFNRAAIAAERGIKISNFSERYQFTPDELYNKSEACCKVAGNPAELLLQINVDGFNRHYIYASDLSSEIVLKAISELDKLEIQTIERKLCLEYHKILFSYLAVRLGCIEGNVSALIDDLYSKTDKALSELDGKSAFYISKLYLIKIYLLIEKHQYSLADETAKDALDFVYMNELKRFVYKFTYVRAQLTDLIDKTVSSKEKFNYSVLALKQFLEVRNGNEKDILREIYVAVELLYYICKNSDNRFAKSLLDSENKIHNKLWDFVCSKNEEEQCSQPSYFVFNGVKFPTI